VRHVPEGTLRRLVDEPLAVADAEAAHASSCGRCVARRERIAGDAQCARTLLGRPQPAPDVDAGWTRLRAATAASPVAARRRRRHAPTRRRRRLLPALVSSPVALGSAAVLLVGAAAGATLSAVLTPGSPAPAPTAASTVDFQAVADVAGVAGGNGVLGGLQTASGTRRLPFGVLHWSSSRAAYDVASLAAAERATGLTLRSLADPPAGVGAPTGIIVQPRVTATIELDAAAGTGLAGTALTVTAGPAVLVEYGGPAGGTGLGIPTLATFVMPRPTASSSTATPTADELEAYVISQPGLPGGIVQEIRLVGNLAEVLPLKAIAGANVSEVEVDGSPAIAVGDGAGIASGVIWVDHGGFVHAALGLLDQEDVLDVAKQLG
jgi:hypothetical protein